MDIVAVVKTARRAVQWAGDLRRAGRESVVKGYVWGGSTFYVILGS